MSETDCPEALIIAYGDPSKGDDGVGWAVGQAVAPHYEDNPAVKVHALQNLTVDLADEIATAERVLFIHATAEGEPGEIRLQPLQDDETQVVHDDLTPRTLLSKRVEQGNSFQNVSELLISGSEFEADRRLTAKMVNNLFGVIDHVLKWVEGEKT
ncbi:hydrogenase maturation protease [bacterium]|nr:hydrogenase maturation protease [bacterium]